MDEKENKPQEDKNPPEIAPEQGECPLLESQTPEGQGVTKSPSSDDNQSEEETPELQNKGNILLELKGFAKDLVTPPPTTMGKVAFYLFNLVIIPLWPVNIFYICKYLKKWLDEANQRVEPEPEPRPEKETWPPRGEILLGVTVPVTYEEKNDPDYQPDWVLLDCERRERHAYFLGGSGLGKTNAIFKFFEDDVLEGESCCVVDFDGDLVDRALMVLANAASPQEWEEDLFLLDMREKDYIVSFNPLLGSGSAHERALLLHSIIKHQSDSWGIQLSDTLSHSLVALAEGRWSLLELRPLLSNARFRDMVLEQTTDSEALGFFNKEYNHYSKAKQMEMSRAVFNKVSPLIAIPELRLIFGQRESISLSELIDERKEMVMLLAFPSAHYREAAHLAGGLFLGAMEAAIFNRSHQLEKDRQRLYLYIDEFGSIANNDFETLISKGRRFKLGLRLSHQNLSQLSPMLRQCIAQSVPNRFYFQLAADDAKAVAQEILSNKFENSREIRETLMRQKIGQAIFARSGLSSKPMQFLQHKDPKVTAKEIAAVKAASFSQFARPRVDVERELKERQQYIDSLEEGPLPGRRRGSQSPPRTKPDVETNMDAMPIPPEAPGAVPSSEEDHSGVNDSDYPETDAQEKASTDPNKIEPTYTIFHTKQTKFKPEDEENPSKHARQEGSEGKWESSEPANDIMLPPKPRSKNVKKRASSQKSDSKKSDSKKSDSQKSDTQNEKAQPEEQAESQTKPQTEDGAPESVAPEKAAEKSSQPISEAKDSGENKEQ